MFIPLIYIHSKKVNFSIVNKHPNFYATKNVTAEYPKFSIQSLTLL